MQQSAKLSVSGHAATLDSPRVRFLVQALLIVLVAIVLRAYGIGRQSLWTDELFSRYYADLFSLKFLWTTGFLHENSPPLYYMAIAGWMWLFGTSEAAMRSLSLVASVLTLPLIYLVGKELFDERRGLLAALIFAVLPVEVGFAQEARTYALLLIPIAAALLAICRFLRGDMRQRVLWLYGIGVIIALYCHATAAFFIAACNVAVIAAIVTRRPAGWRGALIRWIAANACVAVLAVPELIAMLVQGRSDEGLSWIGPFQPIDVVRALSPVIAGVSTPDRFPGVELSFLLVASLAIGLIAIQRSLRAWIVLAVIPAVFAILIALASLLAPIFITRVFCWFGIPIALLLADALATPWRLRPLLAGIAILTCITGLFYHFATSHNEPWRDLFAQIGPRLAHADDVVLSPMTDPTPVAYYAPYLDHVQKWSLGPSKSIEDGLLPQRMGVETITQQQLADDIKSGASVWLITRTPDTPYLQPLLATVPAPNVHIDRSCGSAVCISVLAWTGKTDTAPR